MATNQKKGSKKPTPNKKGFNFYWIYGAIAILLFFMFFYSGDENQKQINWKEFEEKMFAQGDVEKISVINKEIAEIYITEQALENDTTYKDVSKNTWGSGLNKGPHYNFNIGSVENFEDKLQEAKERIIAVDTIGKTAAEKERIFRQRKEQLNIPIVYENRRSWGDALSWLFPILIIVVIWIFFMRMMSRGGGGGSQIFNVGKSKAQLFDKKSSVNITFNDVAGLEEAKMEVKEIVDFLKYPKKYTQLGGKIPKGALLVGPPGTGKTLLAKAMAGEAKVPFFSLSGSDFVEMFVGVGASRVRDLFKQAKEKAPCIVFIDEIDAIGRSRGRSSMTGANDERENTLNQLLTEMDGFATNAGVIILAATNRAEILDRALLRAGRFDRQIHVELPDLEGRKEIFKVHLKPLKIEKDLDVAFLAKQTPGFSGADIANVCNEAALIAARNNKKAIGKQDFLDAVDRIIGGLEKRSKIISKDEKKTIAFHEAGHATVSWLTEHAHPLLKVTIVPRGKALGAAWYLPEERQLTTYDQMFDELCAALGGRAAEEIIFKKISTGALNDLEKVTKQAFSMITYFGLNKKIGNISYYDSTGQQEYSFHKPYSEDTAKVIDKELSLLVESAYTRAKKILLDNKEKLIKLATILLEKEVIFREDVEAIFGKRPYEKASDEEVEKTEKTIENKTEEKEKEEITTSETENLEDKQQEEK
jgi:ATP-dependent metalloprotease FtsH